MGDLFACPRATASAVGGRGAPALELRRIRLQLWANVYLSRLTRWAKTLWNRGFAFWHGRCRRLPDVAEAPPGGDAHALHAEFFQPYAWPANGTFRTTR